MWAPALLKEFLIDYVLMCCYRREPNHNHDSLVPYLLRNAEVEDGICLDFFNEAVERMKDDETVAPIFTDAMVELSQRLATKTMNEDYKTYVNVSPPITSRDMILTR